MLGSLTIAGFYLSLESVLILLIIIIAWLFLNQHRRLQKLYAFYEVGAKLTSNITLPKLLQEVMELIKEETSANACTFYLVDLEKQELSFNVALGKHTEKFKNLHIPIDEQTICGYVAKHRKILNIKDIRKEKMFGAERKVYSEGNTLKEKALLTMPVIYKDQLIGVVQVIKSASSFKKQDIRTIEMLSTQISIAIENADMYQKSNTMFLDSIAILSKVIDVKDNVTKGHSGRVAGYTKAFALYLGMEGESFDRLYYMAMLHDLGKVGIEDAILKKTGSLTREEFEIMKTHTLIGADIVEGTSLEYLAIGMKYHHEKYGGTGYCEGLKGTSIPFEARVICIVDAYDAMTTERPYKDAYTKEFALEEIKNCAGTAFDPTLAEQFIDFMKNFESETEKET